MHRISVILLFASISVLLCASKCDDVHPSASDHGPNPASELELRVGSTGSSKSGEPDCIATKEDPFKCIERACLSVEGAYDPNSHFCECKESRQVFTALSGGRCFSFESPFGKTSYDDFNKTTSVDFISLDYASNILAQAGFSEEQDGIQPTSIDLIRFGCNYDKQIHESWYREFQASIEQQAKLPMVPGGAIYQGIVACSNEETGKAFLDNLDVAEVVLIRRLDAPQHIRRYFEPDAKRWQNLVQRKRHIGGTEFNLPSELNISDAMKSALIQAWKNYDERNLPASVKTDFFTQDGCAGHCTIENDQRQGNILIRYLRQFVGGSTIRNQIVVNQLGLPLYESKSIVLEIDPSESPNLVYFIETSRDNSSGHLVTGVDVFSRLGSPLHSSRKITLVATLEEQLRLRDLNRATQNVTESSIVICEGGFDPVLMQTKGIGKYRTGPNTESSFWGWIVTGDARGAFADSLTGMRWMTDLNRPYFEMGASINSHAVSVASLATQNSSLSAIPISSGHCFSEYERWKKTVEPHAKVINLSASYSYDNRSCTLEPRFAASLGDKEQPFLWVVAAGNQKRRNMRRETALICPQALDASNIIVVAATNKGSDTIADYSNSGRYYADIAADGSGYFEDQDGTSFATPRVSRLAAMLGDEFPTLSIAQIRAAILLGARIPYSVKNKWSGETEVTPHFLETRSGGVLDEVSSHKVALHMVESGRLGFVSFDVASSILNEVECLNDESSPTCKIARLKMKWMKDTKVFAQ